MPEGDAYGQIQFCGGHQRGPTSRLLAEPLGCRDSVPAGEGVSRCSLPICYASAGALYAIEVASVYAGPLVSPSASDSAIAVPACSG